jgi:cytochrome c553
VIRALVVALALPCSAAAADAPPPGRAKARVCATCHGALGISTAPDAPNLAGQPRIYMVEQLKQFRSGKRASEVMKVIAGALSDADIEDLATWYSSIAVEAKEPR